MTTLPKIGGALPDAAFQAQSGKVDQLAAKAGKASENSQDRAEVKKLAEEFEALFLGIVLKSMRDTVQKSGLVDGGNAEDIYRSFLDAEYAKDMAAQRSTGLADNIENYLLKAMGLESAATKAEGLRAYGSNVSTPSLGKDSP